MTLQGAVQSLLVEHTSNSYYCVIDPRPTHLFESLYGVLLLPITYGMAVVDSIEKSAIRDSSLV